MVMPVGLAAASRLLASKGTREAVKKYGKKLIDEVKAYNSKTTTANKTRNVGGAAVRAKNLMEQQKRTKKNRNVSGRNKPKTTKSRTAKPRK